MVAKTQTCFGVITVMLVYLFCSGCNTDTNQEKKHTSLISSKKRSLIAKVDVKKNEESDQNTKSDTESSTEAVVDGFTKWCVESYTKKGVSSDRAHNYCGGQVGDDFGYKELNARRKSDEKFCKIYKKSNKNVDCGENGRTGTISLKDIGNLKNAEQVFARDTQPRGRAVKRP